MSARRGLAAVLAAILIAACAATSRAAEALDAPPSGITPTSATLIEVLTKNKSAIGKMDKPVNTRERIWRLNAFGLSGKARRVESGSDFKETISLGPFTQLRGRRGGQLWRQNENGLTLKLVGLHQREAISERALVNALTNPYTTDVRLLGEVREPVGAYVVDVDPPIGRHEWLFYDKISGQLIRREAIVINRRIVTTFEGFHTVNGLTEPWHEHISDGRPNNEEDWILSVDRLNPPLTARGLDIPSNRRRFVQFPAGVTDVPLPARIAAGKIVIRVDIQGRGLDFMLDSGASGIILDEGITRELGLPTYGRSTQTTAGSYDQTTVQVPEMRIGGLRLHDVVANSLPFQLSPIVGIKIVGILGFDFIDDAIIRIDYEHESIDALAPGGTPWVGKKATALPVILDDGVPFVSARIGDASSEHFILDTGSSSGVVFSDFAQAHRDAIADQGLGSALVQASPLRFARSIGGAMSVSPTQVKTFNIGGQIFDHWLFYVLGSSRAFEGEDEDGLVGYDSLRYFTVYLDYRSARVFLERNGIAIERPQAPQIKESLPPPVR